MLGKTDYCVFKKEVIQFWNDDISDYLGNYTTLAKDIAREILNADGYSSVSPVAKNTEVQRNTP